MLCYLRSRDYNDLTIVETKMLQGRVRHCEFAWRTCSRDTPKDPIALGGVTLTMPVLGLVAAWVAARHALAVDPMVLLREE